MKSMEDSAQSFDVPKILIADDDEATRILLRMALTQWGYQVVEARDGEEAWKILTEESAPQILTLDWLMPKLDGVSLCKRIDKELDARPYIIFLTKMAGTENVIKGLEAGADEFILKPFDLAELRIRIYAGERIIKYRNQLREQTKQLQNTVANIKKLAIEQVNQLIPFDDLVILLREIDDMLSEASKQLSQQKENSDSLQKIQTAQTKLNNMIDIMKGFSLKKSDPNKKNTKNVNHALMNMQRMQDFFGNDISAIKEFMKTFISLSGEQLDEIKSAIEKKDNKTAKYYFHLLGSASANSGVMDMYQICGKAEEEISQSNWINAKQCYDALISQLVTLQKQLDDMT